MSEAATNQETGVADTAATAQSDDIDTEAFDRMEAPAEDGDDPATGADDPDADKGKPAAEDPDHVEVERNGQKFKVPKALEAELLMHQDYTRKTQEVGEQRRALDTERTTWESQREESRAALPEEYKRVAVLDHSIAAVRTQLAGFDDVDWATFRAQAQDDDAKADLYRSVRRQFDSATEQLADLQREHGQATTDLTAKEQARLDKQRDEANASLVKQRQDTVATLTKTIPGWDVKKAASLIGIGMEFGLTPAEAEELTDVRSWNLFQEVYGLRETNAKLTASLKQHQTADQNTKAQQVAPAEKAKGSGAANARDPATSRGDALSTEEWMARRNKQVAAKQRR